jgi:GTPase SAR1 family protein
MALRDRLLEGPGAAMDGLLSLCEAALDPNRFAADIGRLIGEAVGPARTLITLRIGGLGRRRWSQIPEPEAMAIAEDLLRNIREPGDTWLAMDAAAEASLRELSPAVRKFGLRSLLAVAIPAGQRVAGVICVDDPHRAGQFGRREQRLLQRLADVVGLLLPLMQPGRPQAELPEPVERHGVILSSIQELEALDAVAMELRGRPQANLLISGPPGVGKSVLAERFAREVLGCDGMETLVLRPRELHQLIPALGGSGPHDCHGAVERGGALQRALSRGRALFLDDLHHIDEPSLLVLLGLLQLPHRHLRSERDPGLALERPLHILLGTSVAVDGGRWREHFSETLWRTIGLTHVRLSPLRGRGPEVVYQYLEQALRADDAHPPELVFEPGALRAIVGWPWPGQLAQLRAFALEALALHRELGRPLTLADLRWSQGAELDEDTGPGMEVNGRSPWDSRDRSLENLLAVLMRTGYQQNRAAEELGLSPSQFNKLLNRYGMLSEVKRRRKAFHAQQRSSPPRR